MAGDVQHVIDPPHDREVAGLLVADRTIAGQIELSAELIGEIRLAVAIRIAPDRPNHRRPWPFDDEDAAMTVRNFMARLIDDRGHDSG